MKKGAEPQQSHSKVNSSLPQEKTEAKDLESGVKFLDLRTAARYSSLSFWTVREFVISGKLPSVKLPHPHKRGKYLRRILIDREDLDTFLNGFKTRLH